MTDEEALSYFMISIVLYTTISANDTNNGYILMSNTHFVQLFQLSQADNISFAERKTIKPITAIPEYSGIPVETVIDVAPAAVGTTVVNIINYQLSAPI